MSFKRVNEERFNLALVAEEATRLRYHSKRLGWQQNAIMQAGINMKLNELDEQELNEKHAKAARRRGATVVGNLPTIDGSERAPASAFALPPLPPGLQSIINPEPEEKMPARFENALDTWVRESRKQTSAVDVAICVQKMQKDLRERGASERQVEQLVAMLHERLANLSTIEPKQIVKLPDDVPITNADADY